MDETEGFTEGFQYEHHSCHESRILPTSDPTIRCLVNKSALENETAREKRVAFEARAAVSEEQLEQAMAAARERAANRWRTDLEKSAENAESAQREEEVAKVRCHEWLKGEPRVA